MGRRSRGKVAAGALGVPHRGNDHKFDHRQSWNQRPAGRPKNLFEIPVLFYALALYPFATKQVDTVYVGAAWVFVAFRVLHSAVHCTFNLVMLRFYLYLFASLAVWFMAIRAALAYFAA